MQWLLDIMMAFWATMAEMAPWLLFGFAAAGVLSVAFKPAWIEKHLGGGTGWRGAGSVVKASVLGVPLPLCSCGVIPVGTGLYRHGASRGATSSFLLSTPQTGVDSLFATYALMGPVFAVVRPVVALVSGIVGGLLIDRVTGGSPAIGRGGNTLTPLPEGGAEGASSMVQDGAVQSGRPSSNPSRGEGDQNGAGPHPGGGCCGSLDEALPTEAAGRCAAGAELTGGPPSPGSSHGEGDQSGCCGSGVASGEGGPMWKKALRYAAVTLPADIAGSLLLGLAVAAVLTALVPADALSPYLGGGLVAMGAAVAFSTPLYVCATGSIPVGLGLLAVGASPGAVLAFLIAGPATNAATLAVTWKVMGRATGLLYLATVVVVAVGAGLGLDAAFTLEQLRLPAGAMQGHEHAVTWADHLWAGALAVLLLPALWRRFGPTTQAAGCGEGAREGRDTRATEAVHSAA